MKPSTINTILIGGTSHVGKSTVATELSDKLKWEYRSTDKLARHPGRPWNNQGKPLKDRVREHYENLTVPELLTDVLRHYKENVAPPILDILNETGAKGLVLEGSAIWPKHLANQLDQKVKAFWLTIPEQAIERRIYTESLFETRDEKDKYLIQQFLDRSIEFQRRLEKELKALDCKFIDCSEQNITNAIQDLLSSSTKLYRLRVNIE